ncbi:MAG: hypothetical protein ACAH27_05545 [Xanthobacteraceae bacterium]
MTRTSHQRAMSAVKINLLCALIVGVVHLIVTSGADPLASANVGLAAGWGALMHDVLTWREA